MVSECCYVSFEVSQKFVHFSLNSCMNTDIREELDETHLKYLSSGNLKPVLFEKIRSFMN